MEPAPVGRAALRSRATRRSRAALAAVGALGALTAGVAILRAWRFEVNERRDPLRPAGRG